MADYYIDGLNGNDADAGTLAAPWKTIGQAVTNPIVGGDRVFVQATANYAESPDFSSIDGAIATPIVLEGFTASVGDGGRAAITGDGSTADTLFTGNFYSIRNFTITGGPNPGDTRGIRSGNFCVVENCEVDGQSDTDHGIDMNVDCYAVGCYAHDCTVDGFRFFGVGGAFGCLADNCRVGLQNVVRTFGYFYCIARGNTIAGLVMNSSSDSEPIVNCTVDGLSAVTSTGISHGTSGAHSMIINCAVINCNVGIEMSSSASSARNWSFNNLLFGNNFDYGGGGSTAAGEITADPKFVSEAAKDYGPDTGSPLIMAGFDARIQSWLTHTGDAIDIGALQSGAGGPNFAGAFLNWGVN